jgi:hypothetical protein
MLYDNLSVHKSWTKTLWDFVMRSELVGTCRGKRCEGAGT